MTISKDIHIMTRSLNMRLRVLRAERRLSLREASALTGVDKVSLSRFERGLAHPQDRTLAKIATGYDVPVEELLEEEPVPLGEAPGREGLGAKEISAVPSPAETSEEARRTLAKKRLLSPLDPFATRIEGQRKFWMKLAESGKVHYLTIEYATQELDLTSVAYERLVNDAIAEGWTKEELGLLLHVHQSVDGPYKRAWIALLEAWGRNAANPQDVRRLRLAGDESLARVEKKITEALAAA